MNRCPLPNKLNANEWFSLTICVLFLGLLFSAWDFVGIGILWYYQIVWTGFEVCAVISIAWGLKSKTIPRWRRFTPMAICGVTLAIAAYAPLTDLWLYGNFWVNLPLRTHVVNLVQSRQLVPKAEDQAVIFLPFPLSCLSKGGAIWIHPAAVQKFEVTFFTFGGVLTHYAAFQHEPNDTAPFDRGNRRELMKMCKNWYWESY